VELYKNTTDQPSTNAKKADKIIFHALNHLPKSKFSFNRCMKTVLIEQ